MEIKTKNTIGDLNNVLFEQLERLNELDLKEEDLEKEKERAKAISQVAQTIINSNDLAIKAIKMSNEYGKDLPRNLMIGEGNE